MAQARGGHQDGTVTVLVRQRQWLGAVGWLGLFGFAASLAVAYAAAAGPRFGWLTFTLAATAASVLGVRLSVVVEVTGGSSPALRVGRAVIPVSALGSPQELAGAALAQARTAPQAQHGFWAAPGWCHQAILLGVEDATDPHAFWVVGSRNPDALVSALRAARA